MTILDIAAVQWAITTLDITARDESTVYLHRWIIGENVDRTRQPPGIKNDYYAGRISLIQRDINVHGKEIARRLPEMGWGLDEKAIPKELLTAEVTHLDMRCRDGIRYEVTVDVLLSKMEAEMLKAELKEG